MVSPKLPKLTTSTCSWDVPRAHLRLWLALGLGVLGAALLGGQQHFSPSPLARAGRVTLVVWTAAAIAGAIILRRMERARLPWPMLTLTGAALLLSAAYPAESGTFLAPSGPKSAWLLLMLMLLFAAGVAGSGARFERWAFGQWFETLLRAPGVALTAPMLLFASRPDRARPASRADALTRAVFAVLPHLTVGGFLAVSRLEQLDEYRYGADVAIWWFSFSAWTWFGCAILFVLNPWPQYPRASKPEERRTGFVLSHAGVVMLIMALLAVFVGFREYLSSWRGLVYFLSGAGMLVWPVSLLALFLMLGPWSPFARVPRMGELPRARRAGPVSAGILMLSVLAVVGSVAWKTLVRVVTGRLFVEQINRGRPGAGEHPSVGSYLAVFTICCLLAFTYVAAVRWMSDRRGRWGYWVFAAAAIALCVCLLAVLADPFWWLIMNVREVGWTTRRALGLCYSAGGYLVVLVYLYWVTRPDRGFEAAGT